MSGEGARAVGGGSRQAEVPIGAGALCLVLHDVAPATWTACRRVIDAIDEVAALPLTLLAVPRYHGGGRDPAFEAWLRARAAHGDEVALHGYTHRDDGPPPGGAVDRLRRHVYTRGEGEFAALPRDEAARRLAAGRAWLDEIGLAPRGFVAPAWLMGEASWQALAAERFDYTCTLGQLVLLPGRQRFACQSQVYSAQTGWRRAASIAWNRWLARRQAARPLVRLELHPGDAEHDAVRRTWQGLLRRQLQRRTPRTLAEQAAHWRRAAADMT